QAREGVEALLGHDLFDSMSEGAIVHCVGQLVGLACGAQIGLDVHVDLEGLGPDLLLGKGPVGAHRPQASQFDPVGHGYFGTDAAMLTSSRTQSISSCRRTRRWVRA